MLKQTTQRELISQFNQMKEDPHIQSAVDTLEPDEFAEQIVLAQIIKKDTIPATLLEAGMDISDNYDEFVQLVAAVFYDTVSSN